MIIAVDGPAASGKGTLARRLASHFGYHYLDTGSLYRAVALAVLKNGAEPSDAKAAESAAESLILPDRDDPALRSELVSAAASVVAAFPQVRAHVLEYQRKFDGTEDKSTMVISFPCKLPETTPVAADYDWRVQMDMVRRMQSEWSDNSVSCTVYYRKEDLEDIKQYLKDHFRHEMKTVSFLLYHGHGFDQAPYETINKDEYDAMVSKTIPITSVEIKEDDMELQDCATGACPIK